MMKTNRLLYCKVQELRKLYNEGEKEKAQQSYSELKETIKNEENGFGKIWMMYEKAKENQNLYIDFNDVIWDNEVQSIIKTLRDNGIEKFTFSSTWSGAVKTAWLFTQNGCTLEGLTEINEGYEDFNNVMAEAFVFEGIGLLAAQHCVVRAVGMFLYRDPESSKQIYQLMMK